MKMFTFFPLMIILCAVLTSDAGIATTILSSLPAVIRVLITTIRSARRVFVDTTQADYDNRMIHRRENYQFITPNTWDYITTDLWNAQRMPQKLEFLHERVLELSEHEDSQSRMLKEWSQEFTSIYNQFENFLVSAPSIIVQESVQKIDGELGDKTSKLRLTLKGIIDEEIEDAATDSTNDLAESDLVKTSILNMEAKMEKEIDTIVSSRVSKSLDEKLVKLQRECEVLRTTITQLKEEIEDLEDSLGLTKIVGGSIGGLSVVGMICAFVIKIFNGGRPAAVSLTA